MNSCLSGNSLLWILIILLILGTCGNVFNSSVLSGLGWPLLAAIAYTAFRNGSLRSIFCGSGNGCGCGNN